MLMTTPDPQAYTMEENRVLRLFMNLLGLPLIVTNAVSRLCNRILNFNSFIYII